MSLTKRDKSLTVFQIHA